MDNLKIYWQSHPFRSILLIGLILRLCAAIFSQGYAFHDDHFLLIEAAGTWMDGYNFDHWINQGHDIPTGHSFFYVGAQYGLFQVLEFIGIHAPKTQMYLVRIVHAFYSMFVVFFAYKIAFKLKGRSAANLSGIIVATLWIVPMFSVHNLVEAVCLPPLLGAFWILIKHESNYKFSHIIFAGLLVACSVAVRIQTIMFMGGIGLALLFKKDIIKAFVFGFAFFVGYFLTQIYDLFNWGYPFAEVGEYIRYNIENATTYFNHPWYNYALIILGFLIPPVSVFMVLGYFKEWKKTLIISLPTLLFFLFHSYFPNKQERFIYPILPFIIVLGICGWQEVKKKEFWQKRQKFIRGSWIFFIVLNTIAGLLFTFSYQKRARVESMVFLSQQEDFKAVISESSHRADAIKLPLFYLDNQWWQEEYIFPQTNLEEFKTCMKELPIEIQPNYLVFMEGENMDERLKRFEDVFGKVTFVTTIESSFYDWLLFTGNHRNRNEPCHIYKIGNY